MVNIDCLFLGYRRFFVQEDAIGTVADLLLNHGIFAKFEAGGSFVLPLRRSARVMRILSDTAGVSVSEPLGIPGFFFRYRRRYGVFLAVALVLLFAFFSGGRVWDVRTEGEGELSDAYVRDALSEAGLVSGARFSALDLSVIESQVLKKSERIAWLNINRRGNVAYVRYSAKAKTAENQTTSSYANIVADEDAMVEEITVRLGTAVVREGESVRRGDLLISGVGGGLLSADGSVRGRVRRRVEVTVPRIENVISSGERHTCALSVNFFGNSLNIFKIYRNRAEECDIIEETEHLTLLGLVRLPVVIHRTVAVSREVCTRTYSDADCVKIAAARLSSVLRQELSGGDLIRLRTGGAFTEDGYRMYAEVTEIREIGRRSEFGIGK